MQMRRRQVREGAGDTYNWEYTLSFSNIEPEATITKPVPGRLSVDVSSEAPYPLDIGIEDEEKADADYVIKKDSTKTVHNPSETPVTLALTVGPGTGSGSKWVFYRTDEWEPDATIDPVDNPEIVKHHISIPPAEKIRLCYRILAGHGDQSTVEEIADYYEKRKSDAAREFANALKGFVGFESRVEALDFLIERTGVSRPKQATINTVAKQLTKTKYQHRVTSPEDLREMVAIVNSYPNFADITVDDVVREAVERTDAEELRAIADRLGVVDWSSVISGP